MAVYQMPSRRGSVTTSSLLFPALGKGLLVWTGKGLDVCTKFTSTDGAAKNPAVSAGSPPIRATAAATDRMKRLLVMRMVLEMAGSGRCGWVWACGRVVCELVQGRGREGIEREVSDTPASPMPTDPAAKTSHGSKRCAYV